MAHAEIRLRGGFIQKVVRVGDTVRRAPRGDMAFIRDLLGKLETAGFSDVPRWLGTDEKGREIFTYMEGEVPLNLSHYDDTALHQAARFVRRYHDATAPFFAGGLVACHNDLSPCNFVFRDGVPSALIDFDSAAKGERIFDLAYAAYMWLDIGNEDDYTVEEQRRRVTLFAEAYGPEIGVAEMIDMMLVRQQLLLENDMPSGIRERVCRWTRQCQKATLKIRG